MKYLYIDEKNVLKDLERLGTGSDLANTLLFYAKIVNEPNAHNKSYRINYAYAYLKLARNYIGDEFDWTILPINIDTHIINDPVVSVKNPVRKRSIKGFSTKSDTSNIPIIKESVLNKIKEVKFINSKFSTLTITSDNTVVDAEF